MYNNDSFKDTLLLNFHHRTSYIEPNQLHPLSLQISSRLEFDVPDPDLYLRYDSLLCLPEEDPDSSGVLICDSQHVSIASN